MVAAHNADRGVPASLPRHERGHLHLLSAGTPARHCTGASAVRRGTVSEDGEVFETRNNGRCSARLLDVHPTALPGGEIALLARHLHAHRGGTGYEMGNEMLT